MGVTPPLPSKPQATLLLLGLSNPLRNFTGGIEKSFWDAVGFALWGQSGAGPAHGFSRELE